MRAKIIEVLKETPQNANQLATLFDVDYKTIRHHIDVLGKNKIIVSMGNGYATTYFLSSEMEDNYAFLRTFGRECGKSRKRR